MNAIDLLKDDHKKMKKLVKELAGTSEKEKAKRARLFAVIKEEAKIHEKIEEKFLYPHLKEFKKARPNSLEHTQEVAVMENLIGKLSRNDAGTEEWTAMFTVFKEINDHHVEEEEEESFPLATKLLTKELLEEIGDQIVAYKNKAKAG